MNSIESNWRRGLGAAQAGVSLLAAVGLIGVVGAFFRDSYAGSIHEYTEPVRHLYLAGCLYLAAFCVIHARWGALLRRGLRTGLAIGVAVSAAHLAVVAAIVYVVGRHWESRVLTAGFELPLAAWFTVAAAGCAVAVAALILTWTTRTGGREAGRGADLSGWRHLLPPLLLAGFLVATLVILETYPMPKPPPAKPPADAPEVDTPT